MHVGYLTYAALWNVTLVTPGSIAFVAVLISFPLAYNV
jgi:hypothetical protein